MKKIELLIITAGLLLLAPACQQPFNSPEEGGIPVIQSAIPAPDGRVTDSENLLTEEEKNQLTAIIEAYESQTGNQILIITTPSIAPYESMADYSVAVGRAWNLRGEKKTVAIVLSKNLREVRVANELGARVHISEREAMRIADNVMVPYFANDRYFAGLRQGLIEITGTWGR
jgi:uncharacterized protein